MKIELVRINGRLAIRKKAWLGYKYFRGTVHNWCWSFDEITYGDENYARMIFECFRTGELPNNAGKPVPAIKIVDSVEI